VCICKICGGSFKPEYGTKKRSFCSDDCTREARKRADKRSKKDTGTTHQQRAKHYGVPRGYFNLRKILERDNWKCYICGCDTPEELRGTCEDNAPEIDHVIPLSKGGGHTKDNVRCCCRRCNREKSNEIYTPRQLNLLGGVHA
jgi:5-methylcytosine-specific restriction endonuclease McrA